MAHGGEEQGFGFIGLVSLPLGLLQRQFDFLVRTDITECAQQHVFALVAGGDKTDVQMPPRYRKFVDAVNAVVVVVRVIDPFMAQLIALTAAPQPLLGEGVFQHHGTIGATQHTQRDGGGLNYRAAERLAFDQGLFAVYRRGD